MRERGYLLPCQSRPEGDLALERPRDGELFVRARVHAKTSLSSQVVRLLLEPETNLEVKPEGEVEVQGPVGASYYDPASRARNLLLLGTGTGASPQGQDAESAADTFAAHFMLP